MQVNSGLDEISGSPRTPPALSILASGLVADWPWRPCPFVAGTLPVATQSDQIGFSSCASCACRAQERFIR